jgi:MFS family permease
MAVSVAALAQTKMIMLMSPLVLAMANRGFPTHVARVTLEAHFFAMFAPGFVSGRLIQAIGAAKTSLIGIGINAGTVAIALLVEDYSGSLRSAWSWVLSMTLLGLAWNLCFSAGTVLLVSCYEKPDAGRVQGANELLIYGASGLGSLSSGYINRYAGWTTLVLCVLGLVALLLLLLGLTVKLKANAEQKVEQDRLRSAQAVPAAEQFHA